ncbi:MAG TPA: molybdate ABC transporter substrate-binding protein [Rhizomicrobium sp.]|jgi:molybdate transport system substrate-binding protein|nr:molybdate ABC transporter substrate-binding protein [Rhizomicrobium sp.]
MLGRNWIRGFVAAALLALAPLAAQAGTITVFAAASLTDALGDVGKAYKAKTGNDAAFSFAASSTLARQVEASGGADVFMSADTDWMEYLDSRGLIQHDTRKNLLGNHLVLIAPAGANVSLTVAPHFDLLGALGGGRLSIADPDSVPAGKYARTSLTTLGVWNSVVNHLVNAENVRVALAYVSRGEAPLGIVYTTDALSDKGVHIVGTFPENTHAPIVYPAALIKDAKPEAKAFLDFLGGPEARAIFEKDGFIILAAH